MGIEVGIGGAGLGRLEGAKSVGPGLGESSMSVLEVGIEAWVRKRLRTVRVSRGM